MSIPLHQWANTESRGPAYLINCKYCGRAIRQHFDYAQGHGILGYSGHDPECDALKAGLTVDLDMQDKADERRAYEASTPGQQRLYDLLQDAIAAEFKKAEGKQEFPDLGAILILGTQARIAIGYKPRKREHV